MYLHCCSSSWVESATKFGRDENEKYWLSCIFHSSTSPSHLISYFSSGTREELARGLTLLFFSSLSELSISSSSLLLSSGRDFPSSYVMRQKFSTFLCYSRLPCANWIKSVKYVWGLRRFWDFWKLEKKNRKLSYNFFCLVRISILSTPPLLEWRIFGKFHVFPLCDENLVCLIIASETKIAKLFPVKSKRRSFTGEEPTSSSRKPREMATIWNNLKNWWVVGANSHENRTI